MNIGNALGVGITLGVLYIAASCGDDVTAPEVGSILLELEADSLSVDQTTQLDATVLDESGEPLSGMAVNFESGSEDIVIVSPTGLVTAVGPGRTTITARSGDRTASIAIYVRRAASISVVPGDTIVVVDDRLSLVATVLDADGEPIEDAEVSWTVDDSVLFGFNLKGLIAEFRANRVGNGVIIAKTEGLTYDVNVTVVRSEVGSVLLSPDSLAIERGKSAKLRVVVRDTTGAVIGDPQVVFSLVTGTAATVDGTGLVTGVSTGTMSTITARSRGVWRLSPFEGAVAETPVGRAEKVMQRFHSAIRSGHSSHASGTSIESAGRNAGTGSGAAGGARRTGGLPGRLAHTAHPSPRAYSR